MVELLLSLCGEVIAQSVFDHSLCMPLMSLSTCVLTCPSCVFGVFIPGANFQATCLQLMANAPCSGREVYDQIKKFAAGLKELGVTPGDRVSPLAFEQLSVDQLCAVWEATLPASASNWRLCSVACWPDFHRLPDWHHLADFQFVSSCQKAHFHAC